MIGYVYTNDEEFTKSARTDVMLSLFQMAFGEHFPAMKKSFDVGIGFSFANNYISIAFVGDNQPLVKGFHDFFVHLRTFEAKAKWH